MTKSIQDTKEDELYIDNSSEDEDYYFRIDFSPKMIERYSEELLRDILYEILELLMRRLKKDKR